VLVVDDGVRPVVIVRVAACARPRVVGFRQLFQVARLALEDIIVVVPDIFPIGGAGVAELAVTGEMVWIANDLYKRQVILPG